MAVGATVDAFKFVSAETVSAYGQTCSWSVLAKFVKTFISTSSEQIPLPFRQRCALRARSYSSISD